MLRKRLSLAATIAAAALLTPAESLANPNAPYIYFDGQTGRAVQCVQYILRMCTGHDLVLDGIYGPQTRQAVLDLQRFFGLRADGVVGPLTGDALKLVGTSCNIPGLGPWDQWDWMGCEAVVPTTR